jgi:hypothetical protein
MASGMSTWRQRGTTMKNHNHTIDSDNRPDYQALEDQIRPTISNVRVSVQFYIDVDYEVEGKRNSFTIPDRFPNKVTEGNLAEVSMKGASVTAAIGNQFSSSEIEQMIVEDEVINVIPDSLIYDYFAWSPKGEQS